MGKEFRQSITEFNIACGFIDDTFAQSDLYKNSAVDFIDTFVHIQAWGELTVDTPPYHASKTRSSYLIEPVWQYIQRFLAFTFSGRKDSSGICSKTELYFIWCMINNIQVNLGCWLANQFAAALTNSRHLILGSLITHLAINLGVFNPDNNNLHKACDMEPLDMLCLERMCLVELVQDNYRFIRPGRIDPPVQGRKRTRVEANENNLESGVPSSTSSTDLQVLISQNQELKADVRRLTTMVEGLCKFLNFAPPTSPTQ